MLFFPLQIVSYLWERVFWDHINIPFFSKISIYYISIDMWFPISFKVYNLLLVLFTLVLHLSQIQQVETTIWLLWPFNNQSLSFLQHILTFTYKIFWFHILFALPQYWNQSFIKGAVVPISEENGIWRPWSTCSLLLQCHCSQPSQWTKVMNINAYTDCIHTFTSILILYLCIYNKFSLIQSFLKNF